MRKFEVGKRYSINGVTFEILSRTPKTVKLAQIQHAGRFNERVTDIVTKKVHDWDTEEVVLLSHYEIHA